MVDNLEKTILAFLEERKEVSVEDLVKRVSEKSKVGKHRVSKELYRLWREGKIKIKDSNPPRNLISYVASFYSLWFWILVAIIFMTFSSVYLLPQSPPYIYLRYALGSIFVLYLPGFSLIESLYPKKEDLKPLERLALSIGLSLALTPLVGLILNYTPWGIRLNPIFTSLALLTLILAIAALIRKFSYFKLSLEIE